MKNPPKYADELKALHKKLLKERKPEPRTTLEPLHALVRGALSYDVTDARADDAMKQIDREFVDLNELRVATNLEIQELIGNRYPRIEARVALITQSLNTIFELEHTLSLERLRTIPKREARAFLRELPDIHPFVEAYVMLFGLDASAIPMDDGILSYLKEHNAVADNATLLDAQKFVEHHLKVDDYHDFYSSVRQITTDDTRKKKTTKA